MPDNVSRPVAAAGEKTGVVLHSPRRKRDKKQEINHWNTTITDCANLGRKEETGAPLF